MQPVPSTMSPVARAQSVVVRSDASRAAASVQVAKVWKGTSGTTPPSAAAAAVTQTPPPPVPSTGRNAQPACGVNINVMNVVQLLCNTWLSFWQLQALGDMRELSGSYKNVQE